MDTLLQHEHSINTLLRKGESVGYRTLMDLRLSRAHISQTKRHFIEYLNELNRAYRIENILPLDSLHLARGYNFCYSELGMHSKALEFLVLSHKLAERLDQESLIIKWGELASIHYKIREYQKAIEYEKRHLDTYPIEKTEHNGASHYNNIGLYFLRLNQIDSAGWYFDYALSQFNQFEKRNPPHLTSRYPAYFKGIISGSKARIEMKNGDFQNAVPLIKQNIKGSLSYGDLNNVGTAWLNLTHCYLQLGETALAQQALDSAIQYVPDAGNFELWFGLMRQKSAVQFAMGNYREAYRTIESARAKSDSIKTAKEVLVSKALATSIREEEFRENLKEASARSLQIQQERNTVLIFASVITLLLALLVYYYVQLLKRNQKLDAQKSIIADNLKEKELLLKEIHHRVKNNLQIVSNILAFQNHSSDDLSVKEATIDGQNRLSSMTLVHKKLYETNDFKEIGFQSYLEDLSRELQTAFAIKNKAISIHIEAQNIFFKIDTAIPLGLITTELITNAYKYGFANKTEGRIDITLKHLDHLTYTLSVADNGMGVTAAPAFNKPSLGLELVDGLAWQLDGHVGTSESPTGGTCFTVTFKDNIKHHGQPSKNPYRRR
ncbi:MAG: histidine kinase dimerization/phosphoacceptor domain -containing protein [Salibacteraceae bacterium]